MEEKSCHLRRYISAGSRCDLMPKPTLSDIIKKKNINNSLNLIGVIPVKII